MISEVADFLVMLVIEIDLGMAIPKNLEPRLLNKGLLALWGGKENLVAAFFQGFGHCKRPDHMGDRTPTIGCEENAHTTSIEQLACFLPAGDEIND